MLRLVNTALCFSASRIFFRNIRLTLDQQSDFLVKLQKLEEFSNGKWAMYVRKYDIWFTCLDGMDRYWVAFQDSCKRLQSILKAFIKLEALGLYSHAFCIRHRTFFNVVVNTIHSLPLQNLIELEAHLILGNYSNSEPLSTETALAPLSSKHKYELENLRHLGSGRPLYI